MPGQATDERSRPPEPLFHFLRNRCSTSSGFRVPLPGFAVPLPPESMFHFLRIPCSTCGRAVTKITSGELVGGRERNAATKAAPTSAGNGSLRSRPPLPATRTAPLCQSMSFTVRTAASPARRPSRLSNSRMARSRRPLGRVSSTAASTRCTSSSASGPSRHNLLTRTWLTARNHRRITAPQTRTFNHGAALVCRLSNALQNFWTAPDCETPMAPRQRVEQIALRFSGTAH